MLWVLICTVHLTVCYYHVTYEFQSESTLYCLPECQGTLCLKQVPYLKFKWQQRDSNLQPLNSETNTQPFSQTGQIVTECGFTLILVRDMIITYSQMHRTDKNSEQAPSLRPVWLHGWEFVYELSGCGFESRCCDLNFRCGACFDKEFLDIKANYRV